MQFSGRFDHFPAKFTKFFAVLFNFDLRQKPFCNFKWNFELKMF